MQSQTAPMPPSPMTISSGEIATFQAWVTAGMPQSDCSMLPPPPTSIYDTPHQCSSGSVPVNNDGSPTMRPGNTCVTCHLAQGGGELPSGIGGTVYRTAHEPNDCVGTGRSSQNNPLQVLIIDANGRVAQTLNVNSIGNFYSRTAPPNPFTAKVVDTVTKTERDMVKPEVSGDCNYCHDENGNTNVPGGSKAPGRILAP
jgi:hypothetical protein